MNKIKARPMLETYTLPKTGYRVGRFFDDVYRANYHLLCPCTDKQLAYFMRVRFGRGGVGKLGGGKAICVIYKDTFNVVIALRQHALTGQCLNTLTHECFHAAQFTMEHKGIELNQHTDEAYAHLLGSLVSRCLILLGVKED